MKDEKEKLVLEDLNYNSYLKVPELLELQQELSEPKHHDEMFFIIIHQAYELWFKELIHETELLRKAFRDGSVSRALKVLKRNTAIMQLLVQQIDLLTTLTPVEFAGFRKSLMPASGFQSLQFRIMEFTYGLKDSFFLKFFKDKEEYLKSIESMVNEPSIYDEMLTCLNKEGYKVPKEILERDFTQQHTPNEELTELFRSIYENPKNNYHWVLLFEAMLDFDQNFALWRTHHLLMVARTIGMKQGSGGSAGFDFLQNRLPLRFFPELWDMRTLVGAY